MIRVLKVVLLTAAMVVGATVATAAVASAACLFFVTITASSDSGLVAGAIATAFMGGALAGAMLVGLFESFARAKGGEAPGADMRLILDICGMIGGGALGYVRYVVVRKYLTPAPATAELVAA